MNNQLKFKIMNTRILLVVIAFATGLFLTSCEKEDEVAKPVISGLELGIGNSHVAYIGADLHIETEIVAEGKIERNSPRRRQQ